MTPSLTSQAFVSKWKAATVKERSGYQEHFIDVCRLLGHSTPVEIDPNGQFFCFEAGAKKQDGGEGWADVWFKGHFAWEYKGKHADLDKAYKQLLQYREALENPPLLIVSDIENIVIHTNFTNTVKRVYPLAFSDLTTPAGLNTLRLAFTDPEALKAPQTTEAVTREAAEQFAKVAERLRAWGEQPPEIAHFLIQLLFCLFAEDAGLLPNRVFSRLVASTRNRTSAFVAQLRQLFDAMAAGGFFGSEEIPHFDGRLFTDNRVLELDGQGLHILAQVSALDWSNIEPSIFGTLFERSLDPSKRSQLGAHYTGKDDILLIVEPVLMAPLRRRWQEVQKDARLLAEKRDEIKGQPAKAAVRKKLHTQLSALLTGFLGEIAAVQVLDPACGSGNFLYVALRQLLDLEKEVNAFAATLGVDRSLPQVSPLQLHGIEINPYAHQLAQATIWIGYLQWMLDNGYGYSQPILRPLDNILQMDAILAYDAQGNPVEPEWPMADVIIGNPPFLGDKKMRSTLGGEYVEDLRQLFGDRLPACDLVCYWFEKTRKLIELGLSKRGGLLATQGIRGGSNRQVLERLKSSGDIFWAISDHNWIQDGVAVHVSMIGFDNGTERKKSLDGGDVNFINSDLTSATDLTKAERLQENMGLCFQGPVKVGPFDIDFDIAQQMLKAPNPNQRPNSDVIFPILNGSDITSRSRNKWIIDFGERSIDAASLYEEPFEYVKKIVKPFRDSNNDKQRKTYWWRLGRSGEDLKRASFGKDKIIFTPRVSKHRVFVFVGGNTIPDSAVVAITRSDFYFFGLLQSSLHELWARATGTQLREAESGFRYTPTTTFETFPFPWPPGKEPPDDPRVQAIAAAARTLVEQRDAWLNPPDLPAAELQKRTLTNLYNQRPAWLDLAHQKLDAAVFAAYGWPPDLTDDAILERLLALNLERALLNNA